MTGAREDEVESLAEAGAPSPESAELAGESEPEAMPEPEASEGAASEGAAAAMPRSVAQPPASAEPDEEPYREQWFFDNPSIGRAIRYTFAEKRLARAVFVNALLLVVVLALIQEAFGQVQLGLYHEKISYGRLAFLGMAAVEAVIVSLLAPLGFVNLFEAERREECFDQVVTSGVSPHRIIFGRFAATVAFVGVVLFSSLPFFATAVVLDGATVADLLLTYTVLLAYAVALASITAAITVGLDDTALPVIVAILAGVVALVAAFTFRGPAVFAAWSPLRHVVLDFNDIVQGVRLGTFAAPRPYGVEIPCAALSLAYYAVFTFLGLGYAYVGPDLELTQGLDSFDSVSTSKKAEATQARRGVARTLLRTVQLRFFYENLSPAALAASPLIRALATVVIFAGAHVVVLGSLWPTSAPRDTSAILGSVIYPYLAFTMGTVGLLALAGAGARSSLMARAPVRLGPFAVSRFATLFLLFGLALIIPAGLWVGASRLAGFDPQVMSPDRVVGLYALVVGYGAFLFAVSLFMAMLTTNPYSATGRSLILLFATNLTPALWIPLFTGNVAGEGSAFLLDLSPLVAAFAIARPGDQFPFSRFEGDDLVRYAHEPDWVPFVALVTVLGLGFLIAGIALALRERRALRAAVEAK